MVTLLSGHSGTTTSVLELLYIRPEQVSMEISTSILSTLSTLNYLHYLQAGVYSCRGVNRGGAGADTRTLVVQDSGAVAEQLARCQRDNIMTIS